MEMNRLCRGIVQKVSLGDLPDNTSLFDRLNEIDFAVRYRESKKPEDAITAIQYVDIVIWVKNDVTLSIDQMNTIIHEWDKYILKLANAVGYLAVVPQFNFQTFTTQLNSTMRPSQTITVESVEGEPDPEWMIMAEDINDKSTYSVVMVSGDRKSFADFGALDYFRPIGKNKILPLPNLNFSQGNIVFHYSPNAAKDFPNGEGYLIYVVSDSNKTTCNVVLSIEVDNSHDTMADIINEVNSKWDQAYRCFGYKSEGVGALLGDIFTHKTGRLRKFIPLTMSVLDRTINQFTKMNRRLTSEEVKFSKSLNLDRERRKAIGDNMEAVETLTVASLDDTQMETLGNVVIELIPTIDWPSEGESVNVVTPFGVVTVTKVEWDSILEQFDVA